MLINAARIMSINNRRVTMISQGISHTAYDVMREYMIIGAELDELPENQRIK